MNPRAPKQLLDAYLNADYEFETDAGRLCLRVGDKDTSARRWLMEHCREYAFITAFNPASMALCDEENQTRHEDLARGLQNRGWRHLPARGADPKGAWPPESGFLVMDASLGEIAALGAALEQNAVLYGEGDSTPRVVVLNPALAEAVSTSAGAVLFQDAGNGTSGLRVSGLGFSREDEWIFRGLSFKVPPGGCLLIEGGNGSGKTTLLKVLAGLLEAREGQVELTLDAPERPVRVSYLGHQLALKDDLTTEENLLFIRELCGLPSGNSDLVLNQAGLGGYQDVPARKLSAGQRKRLALARLIGSLETLWLLDEPFANLDAAGVEMLTGIIRAHQDLGGLTLISSHGNIDPALSCLERLTLDV